MVLQTVKTDMVKHDVEVESSGECVDEIDKLTKVIGKHEADQTLRMDSRLTLGQHGVSASNKLHLKPYAKKELNSYQQAGMAEVISYQQARNAEFYARDSETIGR
ncbi:hypothetical protein Tco_0659364 [Tanacetum coccineum]